MRHISRLRALILATVLLPGSLASAQDQHQEQPAGRRVRITGQAIGPEGRAGEYLRVAILRPAKRIYAAPDDRLGDLDPPERRAREADEPVDREKPKDTVLIEGTTDVDGRFSLEFDAGNTRVFILEIGSRKRTAWIVKPVIVEDAALNLGEVRLVERLPEDPPPQRLLTIRGTAIAPSGEPAKGVPIVVRDPTRESAEIANGETASDGTFVLELDAGAAKVLQVDFGRKGEADWLIIPLRVEAAEVDLKDVRLHPSVKSALDRKPEEAVDRASTFMIRGVALDAGGSPAGDLLIVVKVPNKVLTAARDDPGEDLGPARSGGGARQPENRGAVAPPLFAVIAIGITEPDGSFAMTLTVPNSEAVQVEIGDKWKTAWLIRPLRTTDGDQELGTMRLNAPIADNAEQQPR